MNTRTGESSSGPQEGTTPEDFASQIPAAAARAAADTLRFWFALGLCGLLFLGWNVSACLIRPFLTRARQRQIGRGAMQRVFQLYLDMLYRLGMVEVDNSALRLLRHEGSLILAPNHPSMMDVLLVISRLPNVGCIMKADLWDNIFLGAGARLAGFIRNDSSRSMIRLAVGDLAGGSQLLIFPEATRTVRSPVNALAGGYALIAKKANVPVQTILIETDSPYLRKGWPLFRRPPLPIRFRIRLGERFQPRDDVDSLVSEMERYFIGELAATGRDAARIARGSG